MFLTLRLLLNMVRECAKNSRSFSKQQEKLPEDVMEIVTDQTFYTRNELFAELTLPVCQAVWRIESAHFTLTDGMVKFLLLYKVTLSLNTDHRDLQSHCLNVINSRFLDYSSNSIYRSGMFLRPGYRTLLCEAGRTLRSND